MGERRVKRSHPDFNKLFQLANDIAIRMNPHVFFNLRKSPKVESTVEAEKLKEEMKGELEGGIFRDELNK